MKAVLVAEAWGAREEQFRHALVGPSGRELTLEMGAAGLAPYMQIRCGQCKLSTPFTDGFCHHCKNYIWPNEFNLIDHWKTLRSNFEIAITNVFNARPPDICAICDSINVTKYGTKAICKDCGSKEIRTNDLGYFFGSEPQTPMPAWKASKRKGTHLKHEYFHHVERLWLELTSLRPNLIIALGNAACWATLFQTKITALRGTVSWSEKVQTKVLPTFHPAAVLRQMPMRPTCIADYQKARREIGFPEIRRPERWITIIDPTEDGIHEGYKWFRRPARAYANDIETKNGQITIVGFARSADDALVIILRDVDNQNAINYWSTPELELKAWDLIHHGLQTPQPKIYQNGLYDMSYFLKLGLHPKNALHDTMLWHHSLYPELPKSLGFLGSIYANDVSWKLMSKNTSLKRDE